MNLVSNQMAELHHIDVPDDNFLIEDLTRAAIVQPSLGMLRQASLFEIAADFFFLNAIKYGCGEAQAQQPGCPAQMRFQHLSDVHARRDAQRIEHDIHGRSIGQKGHVLFRDDLGHDAFIAVPAGHLVADR